MQEAQLVELVVGGADARSGAAAPRPGRGSAGRRGTGSDARHGHHHTSLGKVAAAKGCGPVAAWSRNGPAGTRRRERRERAARPSAAVAAEPLGIGIGRRARPARPRGPAARRAARPGHRRTGRARRCSSWSSASAAARSPSAATTTRPSGRGSTTTCGRSTSTAPRPSSRRSRSTSSWSTWPRRAAGCERCAGASGPRATGVLDDSLGRRGRPAARGSAGRTRSSTRLVGAAAPSTPVLTAHPTEARRRTTLVALRPLRGPARAARRPAADAVRGSRGPPPPARGDHAPVADVRPARRRARRRSTRSGRRWRSSTRRCSRSSRGCTGRSTRRSMPADAAARAGAGRGHRPDGDAAAAGRAVPALGQLDRRRPRRQPGRDRGDRPSGRCASTPTTSCAATRPSPRG